MGGRIRKGNQPEKWESDGFFIRLEDENCWGNLTEEENKMKDWEMCVWI